MMNPHNNRTLLTRRDNHAHDAHDWQLKVDWKLRSIDNNLTFSTRLSIEKLKAEKSFIVLDCLCVECGLKKNAAIAKFFCEICQQQMAIRHVYKSQIKYLIPL